MNTHSEESVREGAETTSPVDSNQVQQQLARILGSDLFAKSPQLSRFLRFCIDRVLLGRQDELKEQVLGVEVFRRSSSFDPRVDPIVRVEARRLRAKLEEYYAGEGRFDPVIIYFQRGDYVPRFARMAPGQDKSVAALSGKIVVVEDERLVARDIENRLKSLGYTVVSSVATGEAAIKAAEEHHPDLVLMDIALAGPTRGTEAARKIWERWRIPVVYLTAFSDAVVMEDIRGAEPYGYVLKPYEPRQLHAALQVALGRRAQETGEGAAGNREQARIDALLGAMENAAIEHWEWTARDESASWPEDVQPSPDRLLPDSDQDPRRFLRRILPAHRERVRQAFNTALREHSRIEIGYYRRSVSGPPEFALLVGVAVKEDSGRIRLSGVEVCISSEVRRRTNAASGLDELRTFTTGCSNSLHSVLEEVSSQMLFLQEQSAAGKVEKGIARARELVDQALQYLHCFRTEPAEWAAASLDAALDGALVSLENELAEANAEVSRAPLPVVLGGPSELASMFELLLSNAICSRREGVPLRISISAERLEDDCAVIFRHNGAGFDRADAQRIFQPFESFGDGRRISDVTLTICRHIVAAHGGRIDAESPSGEGVTFRIILPCYHERKA